MLNAVERAIRRWQADGLIDQATAERLIEHERVVGEREGRRRAQVIVAALGAVLLVVAGSVFFAWAWPSLGDVARTLLVAACGLALVAAAIPAARAERWGPVGYGVLAVGLGALLGAALYSASAWPNGSAGGVASGLAALATPLLLTPLLRQRDPVAAALAVAFGFAFLFVGVVRATNVDAEAVIWLMDVVLLTLLATLGRRLLAADGEPEQWAAAAFATGLFGGLVLVLFTAVGPLALDQWAPLPVDVWAALGLIPLLDVQFGRSAVVPREWVGALLALWVLVAVGLLFWTFDGALDAPYPLTALVVGGLGGGAIALALREAVAELMATGALAVVLAAWFFGVEAGGALAAALALAVTAGVLFWTSARLGRMRRG